MDPASLFSNLTQSYDDYHPKEGPAKRTLVSDAPAAQIGNASNGTKNQRRLTPLFTQSSSSSKVIPAAMPSSVSVPSAQPVSGTALVTPPPSLLVSPPVSLSSKNASMTDINTTIFNCLPCPTTCDNEDSPPSPSGAGIRPRPDKCATQADAPLADGRSAVNIETIDKQQDACDASCVDDDKFDHSRSRNKCGDATRAATKAKYAQHGTEVPQPPEYLAHNGELIALLQAWYWSGYYTGLHARSQ